MGNSIIRKWSELRGLPVVIPSQGRKVGVVEDFFFKAGTGAIDSLLVQAGIQGYYALPASGIKAVEQDAISLPNEEVLMRALPVLPRGSSLLSYKVVGESGAEVGKVGEIWLGVTPPVALHIAALDIIGLDGKSSSRTRRITGEDVLHFRQNLVVIDDQDARRLR
jgi:sporulation protein YlmC with PRC-barrel domain